MADDGARSSRPGAPGQSHCCVGSVGNIARGRSGDIAAEQGRGCRGDAFVVSKGPERRKVGLLNLADVPQEARLKAKTFEVVFHKLPSGKLPATAVEEQLNKTRNCLDRNCRRLAILAGTGRKTISRTISTEPIQASRPPCRVPSAAVVLVQVAMALRPSAFTKGDAKTPQLAWIEEVRAPGARLARH